MDRLTSMSLFVRAVDRGNFAAAARDFAMSPAMVGRHVRALEERVGAQLLQRTTRTQRLTAFGRVYYERCTRVLAEIDAMDRTAAELRASPRGQLRVTTTASFGACCLAPALGDYLTRYPEVRVDLSLSDRLTDLVKQGFDAAIRVGPLAPSALVARRLADACFLLVAAPNYLAARGVPKRPEDLARHNYLGHAYGGWSGQWPLTAADGTALLPLQSNLKINNGEALRRAALRGMGIILQPEFQLADDLADGRLIQILPEHAMPRLPVHVVYPRQKPVPATLRSFVDFVVTRFGRR